jgi:hypothetical protein
VKKAAAKTSDDSSSIKPESAEAKTESTQGDTNKEKPTKKSKAAPKK